MDKEIAISVKNVSKTFRIPHEKVSSIRGAFVGALSSFHLPFLRGGQGGVSYEEFKALDDVSFEVKKGEFFGIIGRNGSGKSTLLKVLAGIYQADKVYHVGSKDPTVGSVTVNGMISPFLELGIGFNPELSGRDNVYLNATVLGMTKKQIDEKFDAIVAFSELERFIDQKLKNYSSGMQVRLAFSVSIHANRDILLMDEVLAVGDSNFQSKCLTEFSKYKDIGKTVILVTHDIAVVQRYCDRALLLRKGKVVKLGKANEVGSTYITDNMSDEEKRIVDEENRQMNNAKKKLEQLKGNELEEEKRKIEETEKNIEEEEKNKVAEIVNVGLFDKDNKEKSVFETGEKLTVRVRYNIKKDIDNPIYGIIISTSFNNIPILVTNTLFKKIKTNVVKKGFVEVDFFIDNYLAGGSYFVSPAIANKHASIHFDWKDKMKQFDVINLEYLSNGIADFRHEIIIK
jgi:ABC-type polysaccharide/polyol phosphate transport system ATPase subunit